MLEVEEGREKEICRHVACVGERVVTLDRAVNLPADVTVGEEEVEDVKEEEEEVERFRCSSLWDASR